MAKNDIDRPIPGLDEPWENYIGSRVEEFLKNFLQGLDTADRELQTEVAAFGKRICDLEEGLTGPEGVEEGLALTRLAIAQAESRLSMLLDGAAVGVAKELTLNRHLMTDGSFTDSDFSYVIFDLRRAQGLRVECSRSWIQYAFLSDFNDSEVTFAPGCGRVSATGREALDVPQGAFYLYVYCGKAGDSGYVAPEVTIVTGGSPGLVPEIEALSEKCGGLERVARAAGGIKEYLGFNGTDSFIALSSPIVLRSDGDSLAFTIRRQYAIRTGNNTNPNFFYAFTRGAGPSGVAVGLGNGSLSVRADDGSWIVSQGSCPVKDGDRVEISYEDGNVVARVNGEVKKTCAGQKDVTVLGFGNGANLSYGCWQGEIYDDIAVNGEACRVSALASGGNVTPAPVARLATSEDLPAPAMMAEKSEGSLRVYLNIPGTREYVAYPLARRVKAFTPGEYPSYYDNWGIQQPWAGRLSAGAVTRVMNLFNAGEAELAINCADGADPAGFTYAGGAAHGFENVVEAGGGRHVLILVDNCKMEETAGFALREASRVEVVQETELCQAYTAVNPFARVRKRWLLTPGGLEITTEAVMLRDMELRNAQFGMMCVYRHAGGVASNPYLTNRTIKDNDPFTVYDTSDGWAHPSLSALDHGCSGIVEYGEEGFGFALRISGDNRKERGGMFVQTNGGVYNKIYFDLTGAYHAEAGEVLRATQRWEIFRSPGDESTIYNEI